MRYTKLEAATVQLDKAIDLFLQGEYLCALTLAGAAEDILKALTPAGQPVAGKIIARNVIASFAQAGDAPITEKEVIEILNRPRNSAKHADREQADLFVGPTHAAIELIRAIPMAKNLGIYTDAHRRFEHWLLDKE